MSLIVALFAVALQAGPDPAVAEVTAVLDELNRASSTADEAAYFGLFTPDARFIGTDPTEHWSLTEFRTFAEPIFQRDTAWSYPATDRHVTIAEIDCRCIAWFEEKLTNSHYGVTRGSGVMRKTADGWKIEQYVLSFAIPNDRADAVVAAVQAPAQ